MKKSILTLATICCMTLATFANAGTVTIAGAAGVRDQSNQSCSDLNVPTNEMDVLLAVQCMISYPLNLPVGTVLDSVLITYNVASLNFGPPDLFAVIGQNRISPELGAIAIGAKGVSPKTVGQGFLTLSNLNATIAAGSSYWLQITDTSVSKLSSITVNYH